MIAEATMQTVRTTQMETNRLQRQIEFIIEIDRLKQVFRRSYITDGSRRENDAEHSWHLAMMVILLGEYAAHPRLDILRAIKMALVHDMVEIITGDTFVYDTASRSLIAEKEAAAAEKLFGMLPEPECTELKALWTEYEVFETPEAKYVRALDRLQPILLNYTTEGRTWKEHGIDAETVRALNVPILYTGAPELVPFVENLLQDATKRSYLK